MPFGLEYHKDVRYSVQRSIPASLAPLASFLFLAVVSHAQFSSQASHAVSTAPPTAITVAPPTGAVHPPTAAFAHTPSSPSTNWNPSRAGTFPNSGGSHNGTHHPHHTANGTAYYPYVYALPVPYAVDMSDTDTQAEDEDDANYQGGPTVFDRRGAGQESYIPPDYSGPAHAASDAEDSSASDAAPEPPQPPTTLVFKDGHQIEVSNYAIVNQTLFDLTPGHSRKVALADLDLTATEKQNDDRGVVFQLPPTGQAN
jgi:hypothetical protein